MDKCHTCKIRTDHYPRNVDSFDLTIFEVRKSFNATFDVTVHAAQQSGTQEDPRPFKFVKCQRDTLIQLKQVKYTYLSLEEQVLLHTQIALHI